MHKIAVVDENDSSIASVLKKYMESIHKKFRMVNATNMEEIRTCMKDTFDCDLLIVLMEKETWMQAAVEIQFNVVCFLGGKKKMMSLALNDTHVIVNEDDIDVYHFQSYCSVVTFGLSQRSTITASSIMEEKIICCIQREFNAINGFAIEPQEFPVLKTMEEDIYEILAATAVMLHIFPQWAEYFIEYSYL